MVHWLPDMGSPQGRGAREKVWLDEVEKDVNAFDITGDWRQRATQAPEWHAAVTEGAQTFMDQCRAEEADKAEARGKKREAKGADVNDTVPGGTAGKPQGRDDGLSVDVTSVGDGLGVGATAQAEVQQELRARVAQFQTSPGS